MQAPVGEMVQAGARRVHPKEGWEGGGQGADLGGGTMWGGGF